MDTKQAAAALDGNEYTKEGSRALFAEMKDAGLVAVFGASDDLMEFYGAIYDEVGAYDGGTAYLTQRGLFKATCEAENCPYEKALRETATPIDALWASGGFSWSYDTAIKHEKFVIFEDGEPYCEGIVFALSDVPA